MSVRGAAVHKVRIRRSGGAWLTRGPFLPGSATRFARAMQAGGWEAEVCTPAPAPLPPWRAHEVLCSTSLEDVVRPMGGCVFEQYEALAQANRIARFTVRDVPDILAVAGEDALMVECKAAKWLTGTLSVTDAQRKARRSWMGEGRRWLLAANISGRVWLSTEPQIRFRDGAPMTPAVPMSLDGWGYVATPSCLWIAP